MNAYQATIAIMQPYFFPYLGYYQLVGAVDRFIFLEDVNFINRGWINRNLILSNSGSQYITIPLEGASQNKLINEIKVVPQSTWVPKMLRQIQFAYSKAPFYKDVSSLIETVVSEQSGLISEIAKASIREVMSYLNIPCAFSTSTEYPKSEMKGSQRILNICQTENASTYINPIGGTDLYSPSDFEQAGIQLKFIRMNSVRYQQFQTEWVGPLSMIDVLMFNEKEKVRQLIKEFSFLEKAPD